MSRTIGKCHGTHRRARTIQGQRSSTRLPGQSSDSISPTTSSSGVEEVRRRLEALFDIVHDCLRSRRLDRVVRYSEQIAHERFNAGFGIGEVQTAFNVLEESMWHHVVAGVPTAELAESLGLLTTVLGVGKDALARTYVSLASHEHVSSLDLRALFEGT